MGVSKAMLIPIIRRHTGIGLEGASATSGTGVRNNVSLAEKE
jgi:hypothetical protein